MGGQGAAAVDDPTDHQRIRVLEIGHRQLAEQLAEVAVMLRSVDDSLRKGDSRMGDIEAELVSNSAVTLEVRDILSAAKGAFKLLGWIGALAKWTAAVGGAITTLYVGAYTAKHGKPPWP
jgi:hypothetical protein